MPLSPDCTDIDTGEKSVMFWVRNCGPSGKYCQFIARFITKSLMD